MSDFVDDKHIPGKQNNHIKKAKNSDGHTVTEDINSDMDEIVTSKKFKCQICDKEFGRKYHCNRHYNDVHVNKTNMSAIKNSTNGQDGHDNSMTNMAQCHNATTTKSHNTNNYNNCNISTSPIIIINNYLHYDINDLTLFEQYLVFCCDTTRNDNVYKTLMDLLNFNPNKPEYNNIKYPNKKSKDINVIVDNKWFYETINIIENILDSQRRSINVIFNKFRIFLGRRATIYSMKCLYDGLKISEEHKELKYQLKLHINNRSKNPPTSISDENLFLDPKHKIWDSLSKSLTWKDVVFYINKLELIKTDFSRNLTDIMTHIEKYLINNPDETSSFNLLISRIEILAYEYNHSKQALSSESDENEDKEYSSSESNEIEKHNIDCIIEQKKVPIRIHKIECNPDRYIKKAEKAKAKKDKRDSAVKRDDHKKNAKKVNYHGYQKIGRSYRSDDDNFTTD